LSEGEPSIGLGLLGVAVAEDARQKLGEDARIPRQHRRLILRARQADEQIRQAADTGR
jgi:hypothetical protein